MVQGRIHEPPTDGRAIGRSILRPAIRKADRRNQFDAARAGRRVRFSMDTRDPPARLLFDRAFRRERQKPWIPEQVYFYTRYIELLHENDRLMARLVALRDEVRSWYKRE